MLQVRRAGGVWTGGSARPPGEVAHLAPFARRADQSAERAV